MVNVNSVKVSPSTPVVSCQELNLDLTPIQAMYRVSCLFVQLMDVGRSSLIVLIIHAIYISTSRRGDDNPVAQWFNGGGRDHS